MCQLRPSTLLTHTCALSRSPAPSPPHPLPQAFEAEAMHLEAPLLHVGVNGQGAWELEAHTGPDAQPAAQLHKALVKLNAVGRKVQAGASVVVQPYHEACRGLPEVVHVGERYLIQDLGLQAARAQGQAAADLDVAKWESLDRQQIPDLDPGNRLHPLLVHVDCHANAHVQQGAPLARRVLPPLHVAADLDARTSGLLGLWQLLLYHVHHLLLTCARWPAKPAPSCCGGCGLPPHEKDVALRQLLRLGGSGSPQVHPHHPHCVVLEPPVHVLHPRLRLYFRSCNLNSSSWYLGTTWPPMLEVVYARARGRAPRNLRVPRRYKLWRMCGCMGAA
mmetsp:Transcript_13737/g.29537  ORF Transcript_13737/g.29537 Transcript_13737/m.29537 type:complete len:333 (+) Transcript_13737:490-1488(+)